MATIAQTNGASQVVGPANISRTNLTASDTLTYFPGSGQVLWLRNPTGSPVVVNLSGTAPSSIDVTGVGTITPSGGKSISVASNTATYLPLDNIGAYLDGTGTVTITNGTGMVASLWT